MNQGTSTNRLNLSNRLKIKPKRLINKSQFLYKNALYILENEDKLKNGLIKIKNNNFVDILSNQRESRKQSKVSITPKNHKASSTEKKLFQLKLKPSYTNEQTMSSFSSRTKRMSSFVNNTLPNNPHSSRRHKEELPIYFTKILKQKKKNRTNLSKPDINSYINNIQSTQVKCVLQHKKKMEENNKTTITNFNKILNNYFTENCKTNYLTLSPDDKENSFVKEINNLESKRRYFPMLSHAIDNVEKVATEIEKRKIHICNDLLCINSIFDDMDRKSSMLKSPVKRNKKQSSSLSLNTTSQKLTSKRKLLQIKNMKKMLTLYPTPEDHMVLKSADRKNVELKSVLGKMEKNNKLINKRLERFKKRKSSFLL